MSSIGSPDIIQDAVHGCIRLDKLAVAFIDTLEFQRLRDLHQLGITYLIYPSACHSRFEHSIGVYHLARKLIDSIHSDPAYCGPRLTESDKLTIELAALCHDLGHGPCSHLWEKFIHQGGGEYLQYKHELMSCAVVDYMIENNTNLSRQIESAGVDVQLLKSLILGEIPASRIVANRLNGMDVDMWDYLLRDSFHAGWGSGNLILDVDRFMCLCRPVKFDRATSGSTIIGQPDGEWHLAFRESQSESVLHSFYIRSYHQRKMYSHKATISIETMVIDMLDSLEPVLHLRRISLQALLDHSADKHYMRDFLVLSDHLLRGIASHQLPTLWSVEEYVGRPDAQGAIETAVDLGKRIVSRRLYKSLDHFYDLRHSQSFGSALPSLNVISGLLIDQGSGETGQRCHRIIRRLPPELDQDDLSTTIKDGILGKLSVIGDKLIDFDSIAVIRSNLTSVSKQDPVFFFYTRSGSTSIHQEQTQTLRLYHILWRNELDSPDSASKSKAKNNILDAIKSWYTDSCGLINGKHDDNPVPLN